MATMVTVAVLAVNWDSGDQTDDDKEDENKMSSDLRICLMKEQGAPSATFHPLASCAENDLCSKQTQDLDKRVKLEEKEVQALVPPRARCESRSPPVMGTKSIAKMASGSYEDASPIKHAVILSNALSAWRSIPIVLDALFPGTVAPNRCRSTSAASITSDLTILTAPPSGSSRILLPAGQQEPLLPRVNEEEALTVSKQLAAKSLASVKGPEPTQPMGKERQFKPEYTMGLLAVLARVKSRVNRLTSSNSSTIDGNRLLPMKTAALGFAEFGTALSPVLLFNIRRKDHDENSLDTALHESTLQMSKTVSAAMSTAHVNILANSRTATVASFKNVETELQQKDASSDNYNKSISSSRDIGGHMLRTVSRPLSAPMPRRSTSISDLARDLPTPRQAAHSVSLPDLTMVQTPARFSNDEQAKPSKLRLDAPKPQSALVTSTKTKAVEPQSVMASKPSSASASPSNTYRTQNTDQVKSGSSIHAPTSNEDIIKAMSSSATSPKTTERFASKPEVKDACATESPSLLTAYDIQEKINSLSIHAKETRTQKRRRRREKAKLYASLRALSNDTTPHDSKADKTQASVTEIDEDVTTTVASFKNVKTKLQQKDASSGNDNESVNSIRDIIGHMLRIVSHPSSAPMPRRSTSISDLARDLPTPKQAAQSVSLPDLTMVQTPARFSNGEQAKPSKLRLDAPKPQSALVTSTKTKAVEPQSVMASKPSSASASPSNTYRTQNTDQVKSGSSIHAPTSNKDRIKAVSSSAVAPKTSERFTTKPGSSIDAPTGTKDRIKAVSSSVTASKTSEHFATKPGSSIDAPTGNKHRIKAVSSSVTAPKTSERFATKPGSSIDAPTGKKDRIKAVSSSVTASKTTGLLVPSGLSLHALPRNIDRTSSSKSISSKRSSDSGPSAYTLRVIRENLRTSSLLVTPPERSLQTPVPPKPTKAQKRKARRVKLEMYLSMSLNTQGVHRRGSSNTPSAAKRPIKMTEDAFPTKGTSGGRQKATVIGRADASKCPTG
ncbi:nucleolar protein dao-5-like [Nematostella vectensis]|uniref:nucleolar protein dao-5-like n=1 Tax=Nematostella vectensis TaxID=45351 RepID=UPI0020778BEF|nr:nucleolar protein dao-5-like [Nematostella vectensis]